MSVITYPIDNYYWFIDYETPLSQPTARSYCQSNYINGELASIPSQNAFDTIKQIISYAPYTGYYWLGGKRKNSTYCDYYDFVGTSTCFFWLDGSDFILDKWFTNEPRWYNYKCMQALTTGEWFDSSCTSASTYSKAFLCQGHAPTSSPTLQPTTNPSTSPTEHPSTAPSVNPTSVPSFQPTHVPTMVPTIMPSNAPSLQPTLTPSASPLIKREVVARTNGNNAMVKTLIITLVALSLLLMVLFYIALYSIYKCQKINKQTSEWMRNLDYEQRLQRLSKLKLQSSSGQPSNSIMTPEMGVPTSITVDIESTSSNTANNIADLSPISEIEESKPSIKESNIITPGVEYTTTTPFQGEKMTQYEQDDFGTGSEGIHQ